MGSLPGSIVYNGSTATYGQPEIVLNSHKQLFLSNRVIFVNTLNQYNNLMDFGSTANLISRIDTSTNDTTLYNYLMQGVPYLSAKSLEKVADSMRLSYQQMMNVLIQTPDNLKDPAFLSYVNTDYNFAQSDLATLQNAAQDTTQRTGLVEEMSASQLSMAGEANSIMMMLKSAYDTSVNIGDTTGKGICTDSTSVYYMLDSSSFYIGFDSIDQWLQNIGGIWTNFARVGYYNSLGQVSIADSIFQSTSNLFAPSVALPTTSADSLVYAAYVPLWNAIKEAETNGRTKYQLDSAEITTLDTLSGSFTYNTAELVSHSIVSGGSGSITVVPCLIAVLPTERKSNEGGNGSSDNAIIPNSISLNNLQFSVYPNPTNGIVTFSYNVPDGGYITITVIDLLGQKMTEQHPGNTTGSVNWNAASVAAGIYIYQASNSKGIIGKGKIVVVGKQ